MSAFTELEQVKQERDAALSAVGVMRDFIAEIRKHGTTGVDLRFVWISRMEKALATTLLPAREPDRIAAMEKVVEAVKRSRSDVGLKGLDADKDVREALCELDALTG